MENQQESAMLALDAPRRIALKGKDHTYIWNLRRPSHADWAKFYASTVNQILHVDGERQQVFDDESAACELVDSLLIGVEGYGDLAGDWKARLPLSHRAMVGSVLRNIGLAPEDNAAAEICGLATVKLNAIWAADGKTSLFRGLVHRFRHPSLEDLKRFNFETSRVRVRGTARDGVTIYPSRQGVALSLYDALIESVEGYSVNGQPLEGVEAIRREMDGAHKAHAALHLFTGGADAEIEVE